MNLIRSRHKQKIYKTFQPIQKDASAIAVLAKLRLFLDAKEPGLVYLLVNTWRTQGRAITYKELREALLNGDIDENYLRQWMQDYSWFVVKYLEPAWNEAMEAAVKELMIKYPEFNFDPFADGVRKWVDNRAAEFVTNSTNTQIEGLRAVVRRASILEDMTVDQLARAIRPMVGLTQQQSVANLNYYASLIGKGISEKKARDLAARYAARQHRYRGYNIARTELAFAYNKGADEGIRQAQAAGYMGETVKIWCTADDERVCPYCGGLEGKTIAMDDEFDFKTKLTMPGIRLTPPAHPGCRCAVMYKEIAPPVHQNILKNR